MPTLPVQIVGFVDEANPGIVECHFRDAEARVHRIIEKIQVVTDADLWSDSKYPQPGFVDCIILERIPNPDGPNVVRIRTLESTTGQSEFVVNESDLAE